MTGRKKKTITINFIINKFVTCAQIKTYFWRLHVTHLLLFVLTFDVKMPLSIINFILVIY